MIYAGFMGILMGLQHENERIFMILFFLMEILPSIYDGI